MTYEEALTAMLAVIEQYENLATHEQILSALPSDRDKRFLRMAQQKRDILPTVKFNGDAVSITYRAGGDA